MEAVKTEYECRSCGNKILVLTIPNGEGSFTTRMDKCCACGGTTGNILNVGLVELVEKKEE